MPCLKRLSLWGALALCPLALPSHSLAQDAVAADPGFAQCVQGLVSSAGRQGVNPQAAHGLLAGLQADRSVLPLLNQQPEFTTPIWDYLAALVDGQRIDDGQQRLAEHAALLAQVQREYGVDAATVVAVWGVESDYGRVFGKRPLLQSLATLSCEGRRQAFFRSELMALLALLADGELSADGLTGSWAGAFGHTQFMPSTYARIAVDGDGDGRRDLVASIPDALASTANYLKRSGWRSGQPWGVEVALPAAFESTLAGRTKRQPLSQWRALGVRLLDGAPLQVEGIADGDRAALILPAGRGGPALLVFRNYDAIYSYNAAESYALAIATLANRLRGEPGLQTAWPTDDPGLDRAGRRALQHLLLQRGHAIGEADGMIGSATRRAIAEEQARLGWATTDGRAGQKILTALQSAATQRK